MLLDIVLLSPLEAIRDYKLLELEKHKVDQICTRNVKITIKKTSPLKICHKLKF